MIALRLLLLAVALPITALVGIVLELSVFAIGIPLALLLGVLFVTLDAIAALTQRPPTAAADTTPNNTSVSVVIPSWDGRPLLERLMPSLWAALAQHGRDHEVIVVDNGSSDGTAEWLAEHHPAARVVRLPKNQFFGRGIMAGIRVATRDILVVLNNDMVVEADFLGPLLAGFDAPDVFAVSSQISMRDPDQVREETGKTRGFFRSGFIELLHSTPIDTAGDTEDPVFWAGGGSSAIDRRKMLELGGFDPLYHPFYLEDTDLSYQAWKRGWKLRFASQSRVYHEHRATVSRFSAAYVERVVRRHQYLFVWRNIHDLRATTEHLVRMVPGMLRRAIHSRRPYVHAVLLEVYALGEAVLRLPRALTGRFAGRRAARRTDREVWTAANRGPTTPLEHRVGPATGLRILVLAARLPRLDTDGSWILFNLLRELSARHRVTLFSFVDTDAEAEQAAPLRAFCAEVITHVRRRTDRPSNLHHRIPYRLDLDYSDESMRNAVRNVLESTQFDLVQVEYAEMAHLTHRLLEGIPTVYTVHEPLCIVHERLLEQTRGSARIVRAFQWAQNLDHEMRVLPAFSHLITLSDTDARALQLYQPELQITTIPSGVDSDRFRPSPEVTAEPHIFFVGYFRHPPNIDGAAWLGREVFPLVREAVPDAVLWIVGRDPTDEVRALAELPGIEVTGFVEDTRPYMARAAAVAVPIRQGGGLRGKLLEAWSARKAIVTTSRGSEGFPIEHGGNALVADTTREFADQLIACLRDPALRDRIADAGHRLTMQHYTAAATARRYEAVYSQVLQDRWAPAHTDADATAPRTPHRKQPCPPALTPPHCS